MAEALRGGGVGRMKSSKDNAGLKGGEAVLKKNPKHTDSKLQRGNKQWKPQKRSTKRGRDNGEPSNKELKC